MNNKKKQVYITLLIDAFLIVLCLINIPPIMDKSDIPADVNTECEVLRSENTDLLKAKDIVLQVNNIKVSKEPELHYILNNVRIGEQVQLVIKRGSSILNVEVKTIPYYDFTYVFVISIVSLLFLFPAIYIYLSNYEVRFTYYTHWTFVSAAMMIMLTDGSRLNYNNYVNLLLQSVSILSFVSTPILVLIATFYFPRLKWKNNKYLSIPLLLYSFITTIVLVYLYNRMLNGDISILSQFVSLRVHLIEYIFVPISIGIIISFIHSFYYFKDDIDQRRLLWLSGGLLFGAACYSFLYVMSRMYLKYTLVNETWIILLLSFTPISYFMAIVSYRILDIKLLVSRTIVYTAILLSIIGIFAMIYLVIMPEVVRVPPDDQHRLLPAYLLTAATALLFALIYQPTKNAVQLFIDKNFFTLKYNFSKVQSHFISCIGDVLSEEEVVDLIETTINHALPVNGLAVALFDDHGREMNILHNDNININNNSIELLIAYFMINKSKLPIADPYSVEEGVVFINNKRLTESLKAKIVFSYINENNDPICLLIIGEKKSTYKFNYEDISLLNSILYHAGVEIEKLNLQRQLMYRSEEKKKLEEINNLKSFFVSGVSHELKTPITSIRLFAEILQNKKNLNDQKKQEYLEIIQGECDRLNRLINNVLDFSKIEKGSKTYSFHRIDLAETLAQSIMLLKYQIKLNKFDYDVNVEEGEYPLIADEDAVKEVIINLISNAMKYSSEEKYFRISLYNKDDSYAIDVADKGIGIPEDEIKKIFEPFYRAKDEKALNAGGAGIGLALVNEIMTAHNGEVQVRSREGEGSIFTLYFPKEKEVEISTYN